MTQQTLNRDPKYELLKAIRLLGDDETGEISSKILKCVSKEFGERMTEAGGWVRGFVGAECESQIA